MTMHIWRVAMWAALVAVSVRGPAVAQDYYPGGELAYGPEAPSEARFSYEQIEQMVAPIALYPDALLAQVLMASTYPLEVVQAGRWLEDHRYLEGADLEEAVSREPWDPSVKTLVLVPGVIERMNDDLDWSQDLGDAFLGQEAEVMDAVQRLRWRAYEAGTLVSNDRHSVVVDGARVRIVPADPAVVHVPTYNPSRVYGSSWAPATTYYPTLYDDAYYPSSYDPGSGYSGYSGSSTPTWVTFGAGALVGALLTAAIMWDDDDDDDDHHHHHYDDKKKYQRHVYYRAPSYWSRDWDGPRYGRRDWYSYRPRHLERGDVYIDRSKTVNIQNNYYGTRWEHDPTHRRGVSYRDVSTTKRVLKLDDAAAIERTRPARVSELVPVEQRAKRSRDRGDWNRRQEQTRRVDRPGEAVTPRDPSAEAASKQDRARERGPAERARVEDADRWQSRSREPAEAKVRPSATVDERPRIEEAERAQTRSRERAEAKSRQAVAPAEDRARAEEVQRSQTRSREQVEAKSRSAASAHERNRVESAERWQSRPREAAEPRQRPAPVAQERARPRAEEPRRQETRATERKAQRSESGQRSSQDSSSAQDQRTSKKERRNEKEQRTDQVQ